MLDAGCGASFTSAARLRRPKRRAGRHRVTVPRTRGTRPAISIVSKQYRRQSGISARILVTQMKVAVAGMWHLGAVSAACLASGGHQVVGVDPDPNLIASLNRGVPAVAEPGLDTMISAELKSGRLTFSNEYDSVAGQDVILIAFDTPVDELDRADVPFVFDQIAKILEHAGSGTLVLISSQLPVGSTAQLEAQHAGRGLTFSYSPENLRLGKAIEVFIKPDRIVVGVRSEPDRRRITELFQPFTSNIEWMSVESAELSKHALNAFLATSICFINEIASIAESVGADAREVERALKSDVRIGWKSYLSPGPAYSGERWLAILFFWKAWATVTSVRFRWYSRSTPATTRTSYGCSERSHAPPAL